MMTKRWIGTKAWLVTADELFFNLLWCLRCRWWTGSFVWRHPQFSFQAWPSFRPSLDLFGQARLGAVFLQGSPPRRDGANPQKSASLHHHESHRSQFGATDPCGKIFLYSFLQGQVKMIFQHHNSAFFSTLFKEEVILQSWPTARSFTFKNVFRSTTTKFSSFPHPSLCDFYLFHLGKKVFLPNPKIGFNPYYFTKILGISLLVKHLKRCKALASSIWFCLQKLCWCPKSFLSKNLPTVENRIMQPQFMGAPYKFRSIKGLVKELIHFLEVMRKRSREVGGKKCQLCCAWDFCFST